MFARPTKKSLQIYLPLLCLSLLAFGSSSGIAANTGKVMVLGPKDIELKSDLVLTAERIQLRGKIITNGFALSLLAREVEFSANSQIVGYLGPQSPNLNHARKLPNPDNAKAGSKGKSGAEGVAGEKGYDGKKATGSITIYTDTIIGSAKVLGIGQTGGQGGIGQDGQDGGKGGRGRDGRPGKLRLWHSSGPGKGNRGGAGGLGGAGGQGGDGGSPLPIEIYYARRFERDETGVLRPIKVTESAEGFDVQSIPGEGGEGGKPGASGGGGQGGNGGNASNIVWGSTGSGKRGKPGKAAKGNGAVGPKGNPSLEKGSVVVEQRYQQLSKSHESAKKIFDLLNRIRRIDGIVRDLENVFEHANELDDATFKERIDIGKCKLGLGQGGFDDLDCESLQILGEKYDQLASRLNRALDSGSVEQLRDGFADLAKESKNIFEEAHREGLEQMQGLVAEVFEIKKSMSAEDSKKMSMLNAYRLYGSEVLEKWATSEESSVRDDLELTAPLDAKITGDGSAYDIRIEELEPKKQEELIEKRPANELP